MEGRRLEYGTKRVGDGSRKVLYIMGWANDFVIPGVRWLFRRMRRQDWCVTVIRLPTDIEDFGKDILEPSMAIANEMDDYVFIGLSLGGLTGSYITGARKRVFISPFWGFHSKWHTDVFRFAISGLGWAKTPLIPIGFGHKELGENCPRETEDLIPKFVSLRYVREVYNAQKGMPPPEEGDIVIYCPDDMVVDVGAMKERGLPMLPYKGGHTFFCVNERDRVFDLIAAEVNGAFED